MTINEADRLQQLAFILESNPMTRKYVVDELRKLSRQVFIESDAIVIDMTKQEMTLDKARSIVGQLVEIAA